MRPIQLPLFAIATLAACGGSASDSPGANVSVYKYVGSVQCTGGGTALPAMQQQLAGAGIRVITASCGSDGNAYAAMCGAADGRIGILEIPAAQAQAASALGFAPLSSLPAATKAACQ